MPRCAILLAVLLGACSSQPGAMGPMGAAAAGRQCFFAGQVNGYSSAGEGAVNLQVGAGRFFRLDLGGYCPNVDRFQSIAVRTTGGGSWICEGLDAELIVPDPVAGPQRCHVTAVRPISRAEYLASRRR